MKKTDIALYASTILVPLTLNAQEPPVDFDKSVGSIGSFGGVGLLEMRNARFSEDGTISVGAGYVGDGQNYYATWQATPWLETTLRYSDYDNSPDGVDKGVDVKIRLLEEGKYKPSIAIGLQDFLGDGLFSGEYIVASKRYGKFDFTAGFGFGDFAGRNRLYNVFRVFDDSFRTRSFSEPDSEKLRFGNYFSGEKMAFYGGIEYNTPINGLTAKLEYSTVDKSQNPVFQDYESKTAFNFGLNYKVREWLEIGSGLQHGNQFIFHLTLKQNLHKPRKLGFAEGYNPEPIKVRTSATRIKNVSKLDRDQNSDIIFDRLRNMGYGITSLNVMRGIISLDLQKISSNSANKDEVAGAILDQFDDIKVKLDGLDWIEANSNDENGRSLIAIFKKSEYGLIEGLSENLTSPEKVIISSSVIEKMKEKKLSPQGVSIDGDEIYVKKEVGPYNNIAQNVGRTARILTNNTPNNVERFTIISEERGMPISEVSLLRKDIENAAEYNSSPEEIIANAEIEDAKRNYPDINEQQEIPRFEFGFFPQIQSHFGSSEDGHFKADLNLKLFAAINLNENLQVYAEGKQHIIGNLDTILPSTNQNVPHVRSDIGLYSAQGTTGISRLQVEYTERTTKNLYSRLTAGYLEDMYAGISGELLYRPYNSNLAVGIDLNYVKQREYDFLAELRNYETITGHATLYHINEKYDITSKISVGRYLAKDWGTTLDISREFKNGIRIGVNATFTDMSHSDFGRGSFDKGIYMVIPFDFFWYKQSRQKARYEFRRLGKNGGQKINHRTNVFNLISDSKAYKIKNNWKNILE